MGLASPSRRTMEPWFAALTPRVAAGVDAKTTQTRIGATVTFGWRVALYAQASDNRDWAAAWHPRSEADRAAWAA
jgi:hypothetical protein